MRKPPSKFVLVPACVLIILLALGVVMVVSLNAGGGDFPVAQTELSIPAGNQAVYSAGLSYDGKKPLSVRLGEVSLFELGEEGLKLCGDSVEGTYAAGSYGVKVFINPEQQMLDIELTLPDGGVLRRGTYALLSEQAAQGVIGVWGAGKNCVSDPLVSYSPVTVNEYTLIETEPPATGFSANVYNLISSFEIPQSTRSFAWTALSAYIGDEGEMALYYRVKGDAGWTEAKAARRIEKTPVKTEDYFTVDLTGLAADTAYEYYFGKRGAAENSEDGSAVYSFKTAAQEIKSFEFIAIGDTQCVSWSGRTESSKGEDGKGYMFTEAAIREAFKAAPDAAFILNTGDIAESIAATETTVGQWNMYFKTLGDYAYSIPHFATAGNHDMLTVDELGMDYLFNYHLNHPNNGGLAAIAEDAEMPRDPNASGFFDSPDEMIYSFDYGEAHFVVINTGIYYDAKADEQIQAAQRAWLQKDLEANKDAKWTILLAHMPLYHRLGGKESRPWLGDLIEQYVDLALMGHSHLVTRTYPMKNGEITDMASPDLIQKGIGTVYATIGPTTLNHDQPGSPNMANNMLIKTPATEQAAYTTVSVSEDAITVTTRQLNGLVLDTYTIQA